MNEVYKKEFQEQEFEGVLDKEVEKKIELFLCNCNLQGKKRQELIEILKDVYNDGAKNCYALEIEKI